MKHQRMSRLPRQVRAPQIKVIKAWAPSGCPPPAHLALELVAQAGHATPREVQPTALLLQRWQAGGGCGWSACQAAFRSGEPAGGPTPPPPNTARRAAGTASPRPLPPLCPA
jgi:hypothetical protein